MAEAAEQPRVAGEPRVAVRDTLAELAPLAAELIREAAEEAIREHGAFTLALSGGSTPVPLFQRLAAGSAASPLPWARTHVYFCDERCVPPDHPESNFGSANAHLLARVPVPPENVHRIHGENPDPGHAAAEYDRLLPPRLDLMVLGVGEDGHTASLFPGSLALRESARRAVAVVAPKPPPRRITLTPPVVGAAGQLLVLVAGKSKAAAVARALEGPSDFEACPAQLARRGLWLLDRGAASGLKGGGNP